MGTTVRLDALKPPRSGYALYFHCQTTLVDGFRERYPGVLRIEGNNRALCSATSGAFHAGRLRTASGLR